MRSLASSTWRFRPRATLPIVGPQGHWGLKRAGGVQVRGLLKRRQWHSWGLEDWELERATRLNADKVHATQILGTDRDEHCQRSTSKAEKALAGRSPSCKGSAALMRLCPGWLAALETSGGRNAHLVTAMPIALSSLASKSVISIETFGCRQEVS
ncbi:hypothetical protein BDV96DRAFT_332382 [Lophiotrema nucula]|uniref:Uncharacterized protein n=1 Tax=Lophiotrema nucula TaxID=690887 RepID=A0A6A5YHR0_9PLEO|nr:hypothetical protein BDV96DRAFT_332382 [Lophiotrema nucula]